MFKLGLCDSLVRPAGSERGRKQRRYGGGKETYPESHRLIVMVSVVMVFHLLTERVGLGNVA